MKTNMMFRRCTGVYTIRLVVSGFLMVLASVATHAAELTWDDSLFVKVAMQQTFQNSNSLFKPPFGANVGGGSTVFSAVPEYRVQYGALVSAGGLQCTFNPGAALTGRVRELFVTAEYGALRISVGRKLLQWGTAYFFNPIGSFIPEKSATDISDAGKSNVGVDNLKVDYFSEHVAVSALTYFKDDRYGYAGLFFVGVGGIDTYWLVHDKGDGELEYGAACAVTVNDFIEIHAETVRKRSYHTRAHRVHTSDTATVTFGDEALYLKEYDAPWMWVAGTNITLGQINVIAEFYHSDAGIGRDEWEKEKDYFLYHSENIMNNWDAIDECYTIWDLQQEKQRFRDYGFLRVAGMIDSIDVSGIVIMNMHDVSVTGIAAISVPISDRMSISANMITMGGERGTEYRESVVGSLITADLRITF